MARFNVLRLMKSPNLPFEAISHPSTVDMKKVNAQQARRVLDRWVGYEVSPILWKKITKGLSAGRVQSVALRLICDRENAIKAFKPEESWTIDGLFEKDAKTKVTATLANIGKKKAELKNKEKLTRLLKTLKRLIMLSIQLLIKNARRVPCTFYDQYSSASSL